MMFLVFRHDADGRTAAVVNVKLADQPQSVAAVKQRIVRAVGAWVRQTSSGESAALRDTSADFNIGDLACYSTEPELVERLSQQGIRRLAIDTFNDTHSHGWDYHDLLFDPDSDQPVVLNTEAPPMALELRDVTVHAAMSEESTCFSAVLWIDGVAAATVKNDGKGGFNSYFWHRRELEAPFVTYCRALHPAYTIGEPDIVIADLLDAQSS